MAKDCVISLRLTEETAAALRALADRAGLSVSDCLRLAVAQLLTPPVNGFYEDDEPLEDVHRALESGETVVTGRPPAGYACQHMSITSGGGALRDVSFGCGCELQPL